MKDIIPVGLGIQTSGTDPDKHQLLKVSFVSFLSGARISSTIRHSHINVDIKHCKDFLWGMGEGKGSDTDLVDDEVDRFLGEQSKVLFEDRPGTKIMKMVPIGINIDRSKKFIQKTLPNTALHLWKNSIELTSLFMLEGLRDDIELTQIQAQYNLRAEMSTSKELSDSTLLEAYINCYILADFQREFLPWMYNTYMIDR